MIVEEGLQTTHKQFRNNFLTKERDWKARKDRYLLRGSRWKASSPCHQSEARQTQPISIQTTRSLNSRRDTIKWTTSSPKWSRWRHRPFSLRHLFHRAIRWRWARRHAVIISRLSQTSTNCSTASMIPWGTRGTSWIFKSRRRWVRNRVRTLSRGMSRRSRLNAEQLKENLQTRKCS